MHDQKFLDKEAKALKKLFEDFNISSFAYKLNGDRYYYVAYVRGSKLKGQAIISTKGSVSQEEFEHVFNKLTFAKLLTTKIDSVGQSRAAIDMEPFKETRDFLQTCLNGQELDSVAKMHVTKVFNAIQSNIEMQDDLVSIFKQYDRDMDSIINEVGFFTDEDLQEMLDVLAQIDYIQYTQLYHQWKIAENVDELLNRLPSQDIPSNIRANLKVLDSSNKDKLERDMADITYKEDQSELTKEEYTNLVKGRYRGNISNLNQENIPLIRNENIDTKFLIST
ncbi:hypothetical protein [Pontibacillus salipaludis]|uniref:Uncharacterized protein n=1 Tax=Pontibacillus salipaludis TaxID=1697394 RepID=A0ABQ1QBD2_9BACI|nr:hypothetical protein [Pontibacillus salipaludis]GGD20287.1 hypothetical protein GCM10011389_29910 [Pontibacillus salipaludis]